MKILVTNDDGYTAVGLRQMVDRLLEAGYEIFMAAPLRQQSGGSAALGRVIDGASIPWQRLPAAELPKGVTGVAIDAPPALSVKAVLSGAFGWVPDIVLSGINRGWNTGGSTLHSGTLGAAITACSLGWRAAAVSCGRPPDGRIDTAATVAASIVPVLKDWPHPVALNVNVPNLPVEKVRGYQHAPVGSQGLLDVDVELVEDDLRFRLVRREPATGSGCDARAVLDGFVAISVLNGRYGHHETDHDLNLMIGRLADAAHSGS